MRDRKIENFPQRQRSSGTGHRSGPAFFQIARITRSVPSRSGRAALAALVALGLVANASPAWAEPEFRTIDGTGNNLSATERGSAGVPFLRRARHGYGDGIGSPGGATRASARVISNLVSDQEGSIVNSSGASDMLWQWGQFLDHDIDLVPEASPHEAFDIEVPTGDVFFDPNSDGDVIIPLGRSVSIMVGEPAKREQINHITSYIDASNVYGSDTVRASTLRENDGSGRLATTNRRWLPPNTTGLDNAPTSADPSFPLGGDIRASEQLGLLSMHTLFLREHNRLTRRTRLLKRVHMDLDGTFPDELTGELRYQLARVLVGAEIQAITYEEFLPVLLGPDALGAYAGYDPGADATIANEFAGAAYRLGHSLLSPHLARRKRDRSETKAGDLELRNAFFVPHKLRGQGGLAPIIRGLAWQPAQELDLFIVDEVRNFLFGQPGSGGFDLAALNIQRGRDHGIPAYNDLREDYDLPRQTSIAQISVDAEVQARLAAGYSGIDEVDAWAGMLGEDHVPGALVGELMREIIADQFERLRSGDRFWYENILGDSLQNLVRNRTLRKIIRRNTPIRNELQNNPFLIPPPR